MKKYLIVGLLSVYGFHTVAQIKKSPFAFSSITKAGLVAGSGGESYAVQSINGIKKGPWFMGIGMGIDFYQQRTIPLFLQVQKAFTKKNNQPFVYADAGLNFRWLKSSEWYKVNSSFTPGMYYETGVGWKIKLRSNTRLCFSAGYSFKQVKETAPAYWNVPVETLIAVDNFERYNYQYKRIVLKLGIEL